MVHLPAVRLVTCGIQGSGGWPYRTVRPQGAGGTSVAMMRIRLRQVALVAEDLSAAEADIEANLGLLVCFRDPGVAAFGLGNVLYPVGEQLLEVSVCSKSSTKISHFPISINIYTIGKFVYLSYTLLTEDTLTILCPAFHSSTLGLVPMSYPMYRGYKGDI